MDLLGFDMGEATTTTPMPPAASGTVDMFAPTQAPPPPAPAPEPSPPAPAPAADPCKFRCIII